MSIQAYKILLRIILEEIPVVLNLQSHFHHCTNAWYSIFQILSLHEDISINFVHANKPWWQLSIVHAICS